MNLPDNNEATVATRLDTVRRKQWHQQGEALLTIENARSFLNATGLVLFAPRPQIASPAPSFVEAVLGEPNATPTLAQVAPAREMLTRLVTEGLAVPLNLLGIGSVIGQAGDLPDFVASAQVFSYVFTLRGDKVWKQPPQPTGTAKFSNLAVAAHEALTRRGPLSAYDLATELGKEVTEGAVLRALGELWSHLRVLPLPQTGGLATLWELASTRLNKQIKAGANAGQPTALSALISLYLGQAILASEDEIESFLSPLAARSRVRDVLHALLAARELDTVAIDGKTVLHVAGSALAFMAEATPEVGEVADGAAEPAALEAAPPSTAAGEDEAHGEITPAEPGSRIAKFVPRSKPEAGELAKARPAKFARKPFSPRSDEARPKFAHSEGARPERERRPFVKREGSESRPQRKPFERSAGDRAPRKFADRSSDSRPPRKPFSRSAEDRPARKPFDRGGDRLGPRKVFERSSDSRPPRKSFDRGGDRPSLRKPFDRGGDRPSPRKPFDRGGDRPAPRKSFDGSSDSRPPRKPFDRGGNRPTARKPFGRPDRLGSRGEDSSRGDRDRREFKPKPFGRRDESGAGETSRPGGFGGKRPFSKPGFAKSGFSKPGAEGRPFRSTGRGGGAKPERGSFGGKKFGSGRPSGAKPGGPGGRFGEKKFGGAKFGAKPGSAKFGPKKFGTKKPFGKPAGPRGPRPSRLPGDTEA